MLYEGVYGGWKVIYSPIIPRDKVVSVMNRIYYSNFVFVLGLFERDNSSVSPFDAAVKTHSKLVLDHIHRTIDQKASAIQKIRLFVESNIVLSNEDDPEETLSEVTLRSILNHLQ